MSDHDAPQTPIPKGFWQQIDHQLDRLGTQRPETFAALRDILLDPAYTAIVHDRNRYGVVTFDTNSAFFSGSGGDNGLADILINCDWRMTDYRAEYYYVMTHKYTKESFTYIEGDVKRGDLIPPNN